MDWGRGRKEGREGLWMVGLCKDGNMNGYVPLNIGAVV